MAESPCPYEAALAAIRKLVLEHPDDRLLESFLKESVDHDRAAAYLLNTSTHTSDLGEFLGEWKRIIVMCKLILKLTT